MDRRKAMKIFASVAAGAGAGVFALSGAFKPKYLPYEEPRKLEYKCTGSEWAYDHLDPSHTAEIAYNYYPDGSCMYAVFRSIIGQLAEKHGEPYASFPYHMMRYGNSGISGYGTICGSINGAAAVIGLLVKDKPTQDSLITGVFRWYEKAGFPNFRPVNAILDYTPPLSVSESTLCHASVTNWVNKSGYRATSDQRAERCRRLTGDVAFRTAEVLNEYAANTHITNGHDNQTVRECMTCHGKTGKLNDTFGKMECNSCHTKSIGHRIFANPHYRFKKPI